MNSLFGVELPAAVNFIIAFIVVLALIGAATWLVRRFGATRLDGATRSRQPRLAVIDSAAVDGRRKLIIIRRDNVEHLLMIGGPNDVVVEASIVRAAAQTPREATREAPPVRATVAEPSTRGTALLEVTNWPVQPEHTPVAVAPVRVERERERERTRVAVDEPAQWPPTQPDAPEAPEPPPVRAARPADTLAGLAAELARPMNEPARPAPAPPRPPQPALSDAAMAAADRNLADMAQRLELALRHPGSMPESKPQAAKPPAARPPMVMSSALISPASMAPVSPAPLSSSSIPSPSMAPMASPPVAAPAAPPPEAKRAEPKPPAPPTAAAIATAKSFDSLEQEMASLLGRPEKT